MKKITLLFGFFAFFLVTTVSGTRAATDTTPPSVPTGISASVTSAGQVYVSWGTSTDNIGVIGYYLYRNGKFIANTPGYTYYTDEPGGGAFSYTVSAYDAAGNFSAQSSPSLQVIVAADPTPPTAPTNLTTTQSSSSITLSWNPSTDNVAVIGYYVSRNGIQLSTTAPINGTTYTDTGLTPGTTYRYTVTAYDASGNISSGISTSATTILDVTPPSVPMALTALAISPTTVNLVWQSSTDNVQVAGYDIYRNGMKIGTSITPSYSDTNISPQTLYSYSVDAYDEIGNTSSQCAPQSVRTPAPDTTPPSIPGNFTAVGVSPSEVDLTWQASTDNVGVAGYDIYRNTVQIGTTASTSYQDLDPSLASDTTYDYAIVAYDAAGNKSPQTSHAATTLTSIPVPATTPSIPPVPPTSTPVMITTSTTPAPTTIYPTPAPTPTPTPTTVEPSFPVSTQPTKAQITANLYLGSRGINVNVLQTFLIQNGYLGVNYGTGYYGGLTQTAVQKFQCVKKIICSGSPRTTGWGSVGPRTRQVMNSLGA